MPADTKPNFRTRRYLVDKRFQMKYTFLVIGVSAVLYGILGFLLFRKEQANSQILQIQNMDLLQMVQSQDTTLLFYLGAFFVLQVLVLFVFGVLITHRIAGPVYRVHRYLEEVAESGVLKPMEPVRERDEFSTFFESLSSAIVKIRGREESRNADLRAVAAELDRAQNDPAKLKELRSRIERWVNS